MIDLIGKNINNDNETDESYVKNDSILKSPPHLFCTHSHDHTHPHIDEAI